MQGSGAIPAEALAYVDAPADSDVTFVDAEGVVRFFSAYRIFSRPEACLDRDVLACHREASRPGIARMLAEFREGLRDEEYFLSKKSGRSVDVRYIAVRDAGDRYMGCLEIARWAREAGRD